MKEKDILQQIGTISHEIRNPLSGIIDLCRLLNDTELNNVQQNYVVSIQDTAYTLLMILNDYVDYAKLESGSILLKEESFLLTDIIRDVAKIMVPIAASKNLALVPEINTNEQPILKGDKIKLKQILFNLVSNAIKFTDKGVITISADLCPGKKKGFYNLECSVKDTGIGFDPKDKKLLFKRFSQLKNARGGSGLGLSVTKKFIEIMGGKIDVTSTPGMGSDFHFNLSFLSATKDETSNEGVFLSPLNILIAEDNPVNRKVTALLLEKSGHKVTTVSNGKEACALASEKDFDVILMDMNMPELDGLDASRYIRNLKDKKKASVPIFAMTGKSMEADKKACLKVGLNGFLQKPFDNKDFSRLWQKIQKKHG